MSFIAGAYLIVYLAQFNAQAVTSIPYTDMAHCEAAAHAIEDNTDIKGHAYCIPGNK